MRRPISTSVLEISFFLGCVFGLFFFLKPLLWDGTRTLAHDPYTWTYPVFHFFTATLFKGNWPFWNPFEHGGEPFYPLIIAFRFLDPILLLTLLIGKFFTRDTAILFHWCRVLQIGTMLVGSYFLLRRFTTKVETRLCLIAILCFSSCFLAPLGQDGLLNQFQWVPWGLLLIVSMVEERKIKTIPAILLGGCVGCHLQSYHFVAFSLVFLVVLLSLVFWGKKETLKCFADRKSWPGMVCGLFVALVMALPNLVVALEVKDFVFPLRMVPKNYQDFVRKTPGNIVTELGPNDLEVGLRMPFEIVTHTGTFTKINNVIQLLSPDGNYMIHREGNPSTWGRSSSGFLYLSGLGWVFALIGFFFGKHRFKKPALLFTLGFGALCLGPIGGLQTLLYPIFPPLWFLRHLEFLTPGFLLGLIYFFILGIEQTVSERKVSWLSVFMIVLGMGACFLGLNHWDIAGTREKIYPLLALFPASCVLLCAFVWKKQGKATVFTGVLLAHLGLYLYCEVDLKHILLFWSVALVLPLMLRKKLGTVVLLAAILGDLLFSFWQARLLYRTVNHPGKYAEVSEAKETVLRPRVPALIAPAVSEVAYYPRYVSLLAEVPTVFSSPFSLDGPSPSSLDEIRRGQRWHSYLLTRPYFELVNSKVSSEFLQDAFAVGLNPLRLSGRGEAQLIYYTGQELDLRIKGTSTQEVFWSDSFHRWWNASLDERLPVSISKAKYLFKSVEVPAGDHELHFYYDPWLFRYSVMAWLVAVVGWIGLMPRWKT